jgi:hypothetical protein
MGTGKTFGEDMLKHLEELIGESSAEELAEKGRALLLRVVTALTDDMESELGFKLPVITHAEAAGLISVSDDPEVDIPEDADLELPKFAWVVAKRARDVGLLKAISDQGVEFDDREVTRTVSRGGPLALRYRMLYDWPELEDVRDWLRENGPGLEDVREKPFEPEKRGEPDKTIEYLEKELARLDSSKGLDKFYEWLSLRKPVIRDYVLGQELVPGKLFKVLDTSPQECMAPGSIVHVVAVELDSGEDGGQENVLPIFNVLRSPRGYGGSKAGMELKHVTPITLEQLKAEAG